MKKTMTKALALLLVVMMMFSLTACGGDKQQNNDANNNETAIVVDTKILKEADDKMLNTYSAIAVNDKAPFVDADGNAVADVYVNTAGADALIQWLMTEEALNMAGEYGVAEYGEYLFYVMENAPVYSGDIASATGVLRAESGFTHSKPKLLPLPLSFYLPSFPSFPSRFNLDFTGIILFCGSTRDLKKYFDLVA